MDSERTAVLDAINTIRTRHGLPSVAYDMTDDATAAQLALYIVANNSASHSLNPSGTCYSASIATLAAKSSMVLSWSLTNSQAIPSSLLIHNSLIDGSDATLSDRRWILYPFFNRTTFGRVDGAQSSSLYPMAEVLKVADNTLTDVSSMTNDYVAYPYGNYPSSEFAGNWYLSFSAIANKSDPTKNGGAYVSFSGATISVKDGNNAALTVSNQAASYDDGYGLPNLLKWTVAGLQTNVTYTVTISNVTVNGATHAPYQYSFTLQ